MDRRDVPHRSGAGVLGALHVEGHAAVLRTRDSGADRDMKRVVSGGNIWHIRVCKGKQA